MHTSPTRFLSLFVVWCVAQPGAAQDAPGADAGVRDPAEMSISEFEGRDPFGTDDLGLGMADPLARLPDDDAVLTATEPTDDEIVALPVTVLRGAALDAISGVRESRHDIRVTLRWGLAIVDEEIELSSTARHRAEVLEHLTLPSDAALVSLEVCNAAGCRPGVANANADGAYDDALLVHVEHPSDLPVAHARLESGALTLRAAPVVRGATLTVRVRWVAAAPMHGGVLRWTLPSRGFDARLSEVELDVRSDDLVEAGIDNRPLDGATVTRRGGEAVLVTALAPRSGGTLLEAAALGCAGGARSVVRARAPRPEPRPLRVVVAIDASPSTTAGARGRIADAALVLVQALAPGSEVVAVAFAARAELLTTSPVAPDGIDARVLMAAVDAGLGSMTNLEALWTLVHAQPRLPDLLVVIGDGGVSPTAGRGRAVEAMRAAGVRLASINVANRATSRDLAAAVAETGGMALDVGVEAELASDDDDREPLAARIRALVSEPASSSISVRTRAGTAPLGVLSAGEELSWSGSGTPTALDGTREVRSSGISLDLADALCARLEGRTRLVAVAASDLREAAGSCVADGSRRSRPTTSASSIFGAGLGRIAITNRRSCAVPAAAVVEPDGRVGYVAPSLLRQLRRRVVPAARACFRDDRAGRAHYETRLVVHLVLSDREIVHRSVTDAATPELGECIERAVESLELPSFDGTIVVTWPLRTAGEPIPPTAELERDVSAAIDRIGSLGVSSPDASTR